MHKVLGSKVESIDIGDDSVNVGLDVLQLLSTSMYTDPLTIYREYVQNAADATSVVAKREGVSFETFPIVISLDPAARSIRIRDHGSGVSNETFSKTLLTIGSSPKRETDQRGFRGVGRLVGLGYCKELIFRSRSCSDEPVFELRWDCLALRGLLRSQSQADLFQTLKSVVNIEVKKPREEPAHFFDVILNGVVRIKNDDLLNRSLVFDYLSQVAPVPFHEDFAAGRSITQIVSAHVPVDAFRVSIEGLPGFVTRPFRERMSISDSRECSISQIQPVLLNALDEGLSAVGWIGHHEYQGAFPRGNSVRGIRVRHGNIQIGLDSLMEETFSEERFNAWSIGELHIVDRRIVPNGRRDHFEANVHLGNLQNQFAPIARELALRCRQTSKLRNSERAITARKSELRSVLASARGNVAPIVVMLAARRSELILSEIKLLSERYGGNAPALGMRDSAVKAEVGRLRSRASKLAARSKSPRLKGQLEAMEAVYSATAAVKDRDKIRSLSLTMLLERALS